VVVCVDRSFCRIIIQSATGQMNKVCKEEISHDVSATAKKQASKQQRRH
jgi:hypothetical protein